MDRRPPLTPRQREIAVLLAVTGASNRQLATALGISPYSVKALLVDAYWRLWGAEHQGNPRVGLILWAWTHIGHGRGPDRL